MPKDSPIKTIADLKGKKIGLNKGSNVHYLLVRALESAGLKYTDVDVVYLSPADGRASFDKGTLDAWVIWEPYRYTPMQVAHALRSLLQVRQVVCHTPAVLAGLALLEGGATLPTG